MAPPPDASPEGATARWQRLEGLFRAAVDLSDAERRAYVAWSCGEDPGLRRELEALLAADAGSERFVARAVAAGLAAAGGTGSPAGPAPDAGPGIEAAGRVGPYRLLREIGRGGTGRVFLASRAEGGFGQRVAVKLLRPGVVS